MVIESFKQAAVRNALTCIRKDGRFPANVFVDDWRDYLFFDPHIMFDSCFIDIKNLLMREDDASVIAVINLGNMNTNSDNESRAIFLDRNTVSKEYIAELIGDGSAMNWMFLMDRYIFASDKGNWAIYCEKENDLAVFAVAESLSILTCSRIAKFLKAKSIRAATCQGLAFDFDSLVPAWKSGLTAAYIPSGSSL